MEGYSNRNGIKSANMEIPERLVSFANDFLCIILCGSFSGICWMQNTEPHCLSLVFLKSKDEIP